MNQVGRGTEPEGTDKRIKITFQTNTVGVGPGEKMVEEMWQYAEHRGADQWVEITSSSDEVGPDYLVQYIMISDETRSDVKLSGEIKVAALVVDGIVPSERKRLTDTIEEEDTQMAGEEEAIATTDSWLSPLYAKLINYSAVWSIPQLTHSIAIAVPSKMLPLLPPKFRHEYGDLVTLEIEEQLKETLEKNFLTQVLVSLKLSGDLLFSAAVEWSRVSRDFLFRSRDSREVRLAGGIRNGRKD